LGEVQTKLMLGVGDGLLLVYILSDHCIKHIVEANSIIDGITAVSQLIQVLMHQGFLLLFILLGIHVNCLNSVLVLCSSNLRLFNQTVELEND